MTCLGSSLRFSRAAIRQPYILINKDIPTQKSPNIGRLDKYFFSDICSVIETILQ